MNFRKDYHGETSLSTLEAMRQGVIVIVKDVGWYSELPDTVVIKASTEDEAIEKLKEVMADPAHKERMSVAAKQYVHDHHSHSAYVEGLQSLIALPTVGTNSDIAAALKNEKIKTAKQYSSLLEASKE